MHRQARYFIRTALVCLLAASSVGAVVLLDQGLSVDSRIAALLPVFYHLLMVGWVTQLICGVALWMFPPPGRASGPFARRLCAAMFRPATASRKSRFVLPHKVGEVWSGGSLLQTSPTSKTVKRV